MKRSRIITTGILLILFGIQLNLVRTYTLTPKATKFWAERIAQPSDLAPLQTSPMQTTANGSYYQQGYGAVTPFSQASYGNNGYANNAQLAPRSIFLRPKQITPPDWICWPVIFVGAVLSLQGALIRR